MTWYGIVDSMDPELVVLVKDAQKYVPAPVRSGDYFCGVRLSQLTGWVAGQIPGAVGVEGLTDDEMYSIALVGKTYMGVGREWEGPDEPKVFPEQKESLVGLGRYYAGPEAGDEALGMYR